MPLEGVEFSARPTSRYPGWLGRRLRRASAPAVVAGCAREPCGSETIVPASIVFENVSVTREGRVVLRAVDCVIAEKRVAVIGPNGSGKSTLARLVNGLVRPSGGRVLVDGLDPVREAAAVRRKVGFVFQNPDNQIVFPIVEEDLAFGLRNLGFGRAEAQERVRAALEEFGLGALAEVPAHAVSGGEKQLIALLGVLLMRPDIILLDEPTTMLDLRSRNRIEAEIAALDARVIVTSHDLDLVADFDRVLVMDSGRIVADDAPRAAIAWYWAHMS